MWQEEEKFAHAVQIYLQRLPVKIKLYVISLQLNTISEITTAVNVNKGRASKKTQGLTQIT